MLRTLSAMRSALGSGTLVMLLLLSSAALAAETYTTENFVISAPTAEMAKEVGERAEAYRRELALQWLGATMRPWSQRCPVRVNVGRMGASGDTTFSFSNGEVFGWRMNVNGPYDRILDSVLPHEITHTVLACHFRRPLPRWADEGASTLIEHPSEKAKQISILQQVRREGRQIPLRQLFAIAEYPRDMRDVMSLYAEGYLLTEYLVAQGGEAKFLQFMQDGMQDNWDAALSRHYGVKKVETLEDDWGEWLVADRPQPRSRQGSGQQVAALGTFGSGIAPDPVVRLQSPDTGLTAAGRESRDAGCSAPQFRAVAATTPRTMNGQAVTAAIDVQALPAAVPSVTNPVATAHAAASVLTPTGPVQRSRNLSHAVLIIGSNGAAQPLAVPPVSSTEPAHKLAAKPADPFGS